MNGQMHEKKNQGPLELTDVMLLNKEIMGCKWEQRLVKDPNLNVFKFQE